MTRDAELDRLWDMFCVAYANLTGGGREALAIVLNEDRKTARHARRAAVSEVPQDVLDLVVDTVASARGVTREAILGRTRIRGIPAARQEVWAVLLDRGYTTRAIGASFGKDWSGIGKGAALFRATLERDVEARARIGWLTTAERKAA